MAVPKKNRSLEGTILHIQETKAWQITMFRDLDLMTGEALETETRLKCLLWGSRARESSKILWWCWGMGEGSGCCLWSLHPNRITQPFLSIGGFLSFHWACPRNSPWKILQGGNFKISPPTFVLFQVPSHSARSKGPGLNWSLISGSLEMAASESHLWWEIHF